MLHPTKYLLFTAIALGCVAMIMPAHVEARGGRGGGGGGRGGGGGFSGFSRGGGSVGGGAAYRGFSGTPSAAGGRYTPGSPGSGAWRGNRGYGRWGYGGWGWGWGIGPGYWGFGNPYWYGGYPFWYPTLAYGTYVNPYYTNAVDYGGYDYGVPIQQGQNQGPEDNDFYAQARAAFYAGNYQEALQNIERAAMAMPGNEDIHQFHALVFFALGDYQRSAAVAHTVLDTGPGWNWPVVQSFYPSPDIYTKQLRALEHAITEHPDQAATRFLLGYEYLMLGHFKAADRQFRRVVAVEPRDTLSKNILSGLDKAPGVNGDTAPVSSGSQPGNAQSPTGSGTPAGQPVNPPSNPGPQVTVPQVAPTSPNGGTQGLPPAPPAPTSSPGTPINAGGIAAPVITGTWKASPAPGVTVETTLQPDKHFTWKFSENGQGADFTGTYVQQGNQLILTRDQDGQKMDGTITMNNKGGFRFRLNNADSNDVGLEFSK